MARNRAALEEALGVPVVDPNQAAVAMALARVRITASSARGAGTAT
jgi:allantoin racemase